MINSKPLIQPIPPLVQPRFAREFSFTDQDFERIRRFIYQKAGIALNPTKKDMVYGRLVRRVRDLKLTSFAAYVDMLESPAGRTELEVFVNALTTNLTFFFREEHHFPLLTEYVKSLPGRDISVWCAAASTGEEPYSIAITLLEAFSHTGTRPNLSVLATDLDTSVLRTAEAGIYPPDKISKIPLALQQKYFDKQADGQYRVKPIVRQLLTFKPLNLIDPSWPMRQPFDVIFCRNVMIYFDRETQHNVLKKFAPLLKPDGLLFVGHSENLYHAADLFHLRGKTVYEHAHRVAP